MENGAKTSRALLFAAVIAFSIGSSAVMGLPSIETLKQVVAEQPGSYRAQYNLGLALAAAAGSDNARLQEAVQVLEKAQALNEKQSTIDYSIYNSLGWYYASANRSSEAEIAYQKALSRANTNAPALNRRLFTNVGLFYLERGDLDHAGKYLKIAADEYNSDTAKRFLAINEGVRAKVEVSPDGLTYQAKLSDQDKSNSKGIRFVDSIREKDGPEAAVLETLLQDRANYYRGKRDPEDQASPGLESTMTNRAQLQMRQLKFDSVSAAECLDQQPVVKVTLTKEAVTLSKP